MLETHMKVREFLLSYGVTYVGTAAAVVFMSVFYVISLRIGTEAYGALQSTFSFMFLLFAGRGAAAGYVVLHAAGDESSLGTVVRHAARLALLVGLALLGTFLLLSPFLRDFLHLESPVAFMLIGVASIPGVLAGMNEGILNVQRRFAALALSSTIVSAMNVLLAIVLLRDGFQEMDAGWIVLGSQSASCLNVLLVRWDFLKTPAVPVVTQSALREVAELVAASLLFGASLRLDVFWAKHALLPAQAGAYAIASSIAIVLYLVSNGVARVTSVSMREGAIGKTIVVSYALILGVSAALAGAFVALGPLTLRLLVGHEVPLAWDVLLPLFVALTCYSLITFDFSCLNVMTKRVHVGIGVLLLLAQGIAVATFGRDVRSIALAQCAVMAAFALLFSITLYRVIRRIKTSVPAHPAEAHLQQA
jgi:O-antigen/teichoic acid export membrane protein